MQNIPSRSFSAKLKCEVCLHYDEKCKECKDANAIQVKMSVVNLECATTSSSSEDEEEDSNKKIVISRDLIDLKDSYEGRRVKRKNVKAPRRKDPVEFVDLPGASDYDSFFAPCFPDDLSLNMKGPMANLFFSFKAAKQHVAADTSLAVVEENTAASELVSRPVVHQLFFFVCVCSYL